ncbi:Tetraspanin-3 [Trichoplax sp. H2]|uniref:Tetraspanin n=1 Tax=Trichoplax adhaerens TaxID=10228 RepID=B3RR47_TRIAD|nr:hypothetical protein TRIADDRAFT_54107 [Trichoplax adhaerens]EDV26815.1 hypothetical protein TRIADDRAFT_54107 [Trichoplax adhaerens]RDD45170.1 Tetraspanin-3 [Trichoplax sp. H2]|eukprot:XP_002110811.1 hypothetical protein TRIADDRAFT_54107 [Trichoplax adhaerens]
MAERDCSKCFLCFFNLIIWLVGVALIVFGGYLMGVYGDYTSVLNEQYTVLPFGIIIGVGVLFFFCAVLGWCAASRNSRACFGVFFFILFAIFAMEIAAVALGVFFKSNISDFIGKDLENAIKNYDTHNDHGIDRIVDKIQELFHCCGNHNYTDWSSSPFDHVYPASVPDSCCKNRTSGCGNDSLSLPRNQAGEIIYIEGCHDAIFNVAHDDMGIIIAVAASFAAIQILCMICTVFIMCRRSNDRLISGYDILGDGVVA